MPLLTHKPPCRNEACGGVDYEERGDCIGKHCGADCCDKCAVVTDRGMYCRECVERFVAELLAEMIADDGQPADQHTASCLKLCADAGMTVAEAGAYMRRIA